MSGIVEVSGGWGARGAVEGAFQKAYQAQVGSPFLYYSVSGGHRRTVAFLGTFQGGLSGRLRRPELFSGQVFDFLADDAVRVYGFEREVGGKSSCFYVSEGEVDPNSPLGVEMRFMEDDDRASFKHDKRSPFDNGRFNAYLGSGRGIIFGEKDMATALATVFRNEKSRILIEEGELLRIGS